MNRKREINKKTLILIVAIALISNIILMIVGKVSQKNLEKQMEAADYLSLDTRATDSPDSRTSLAEVLSDRQVYFSGIEDSEITGSTVVYLENDAGNDGIYMKYSISDKETGEIVETTDLIPAGEHVVWIPAESLDKGEHTLVFNEAPYFEWEDSENGFVPLTQANNEVVFTVR